MSTVLYRLRVRRDHRWAPGHMSAYLDGELSEPSRARIERHSSECPECRWVLKSLARTVTILRRMPAPRGQGDPRDLVIAVRSRLGERPRP
ncbi:MAG: zf-HC2 domain-containing protein [Solirubrobacterales bacterium]|nr:zf-HC2 domain-containing protein [Solirubrobacterales bacterium]